MSKIVIITFCFLAFLNNVFSITLNVSNLKDLNSKSDFSFAIFSDNKGDSPYSSTDFAKMDDWIKSNNNAFVLGLGDHLKHKWNNDFLDFCKTNLFWQSNFYPNIADGENEYYGTGQGDWGAGGKFLDELKVSNNKNIVERHGLAEYYAVIPVKQYKVHYINLHYPDTPKNPKIAFKQSSKNWLSSILDKINKSDFDIIIVAAHSQTGFWVHLLKPELQNKLLNKADIVLSGTTHIFKKQTLPGFKNKGALCINTGAISYARGSSYNGYLQVNVLKKNKALTIQYINTGNVKAKLATKNFSYIKFSNGKHGKLSFSQ